MNNISCQQLTEGLQSIQSLKNNCDEVLSKATFNRKDRLQVLIELKKITMELLDQLVVKLKDGRSFYVEDYNSITKLLADNNISTDDYSMDYVSDFPQIEIYNHRISCLRFYDSHIISTESISGLQNLKKLKFVECKIADTALNGLGKLENLQVLEVSDTITTSSINFEFISECKRLSFLNVRETNFDDYDLKLLPDLPNLKTLMLNGCHNIADLSPLLRIRSLTNLSLGNQAKNDTNDEVVRELRKRNVEVLGYNIQ